MTRESKERRVIELYERGVNIRQIAKRVHMSFGDIGTITRKYSGDEDVSQNTKKYSKHSQALELFHNGESNIGVAIKLGLTDLETMEEQKQYRSLIRHDNFCALYDAMSGDLNPYLVLHSELTRANIAVEDAVEAIRYANELNFMKLEHGWLTKELERLRQHKFLALDVLRSWEQKRDSVIEEVETLNEAKEAVLRGIDQSFQPNQECTPIFHGRRRRRRHTQLE